MSISTTPQITIHASTEFLPPGVPHVPMLYPLWGLPTEAPDVYKRFLNVGRDYFRISSGKEADFFVLPFDWRYTIGRYARTLGDAERARLIALQLSNDALDLGKKIIVFFVQDSEEEVSLPNSLVFRTSLRRGLRRNEFSMAVFIEDLVGHRLQSSLPLRPKLNSPSVGFCGFAGYRLTPNASLWRKGRSWARWVYKGLPAPTARERAITQLRRDPAVVTDFLLREHGKGAHPLEQEARDAFYRNLINNDYTLCARGRGNWSIRFYETLSCGRIPLFIDTECILPYDFDLNYKDYSVWVDSEHIESITQQLLDFHTDLTERDFEELQHECRLLWERRLTPEGFFSNFYRHFDRV